MQMKNILIATATVLVIVGSAGLLFALYMQNAGTPNDAGSSVLKNNPRVENSDNTKSDNTKKEENNITTKQYSLDSGYVKISFPYPTRVSVRGESMTVGVVEDEKYLTTGEVNSVEKISFRTSDFVPAQMTVFFATSPDSALSDAWLINALGRNGGGLFVVNEKKLISLPGVKESVARLSLRGPEYRYEITPETAAEQIDIVDKGDAYVFRLGFDGSDNAHAAFIFSKEVDAQAFIDTVLPNISILQMPVPIK